jgi:hypothetical protein
MNEDKRAILERVKKATVAVVYLNTADSEGPESSSSAREMKG